MLMQRSPFAPSPICEVLDGLDVQDARADSCSEEDSIVRLQAQPVVASTAVGKIFRDRRLSDRYCPVRKVKTSSPSLPRTVTAPAPGREGEVVVAAAAVDDHVANRR